VRGLAASLRKRHPGVEISALCDPNSDAIEATRRELNPAAAVYEHAAQLCDSAELDWVMVGSWNCFHREHATLALDAKKHVFCEKPLATTLDDCIAIRDAVTRNQRTFSFGLTLRYAGLYRKIDQLLRSGELGALVSFEFNENLEFNHGGFIHADWRRHTRYAGSHLLEKCCHDIDLGNWFAASRVRRVASFGGTNFFLPENSFHVDRIGPNAKGVRAYFGFLGGAPGAGSPTPFTTDKDILDNQVVILEYENGVRGMFHTNCNAGIPERRMLLLGTEGAIRADLLTGTLELRRIGWDEPSVVYRNPGGGHGDGDLHLVDNLAASMFEDHVPSAGIDEGLASALTCFAADRALETGTVVDARELWRATESAGA
jgi:predicted dehydrogenase